jgi:hypothetical protein
LLATQTRRNSRDAFPRRSRLPLCLVSAVPSLPEPSRSPAALAQRVVAAAPGALGQHQDGFRPHAHAQPEQQLHVFLGHQQRARRGAEVYCSTRLTSINHIQGLADQLPAAGISAAACYDSQPFPGTLMRFSIRQLKIDRWLVMCCIAIGVLIAFPVVAQLIGGKLLEPVAALWGSALGAWSAVAGAFWVADRQASQQQRRAAALVHAMLQPVTFALFQLTMVYRARSLAHRGGSNEEPDILTPEEWKNVRDQAGVVFSHYENFKNKIHRYEAGLSLLSASSLQTALAVEAELEDAIRDAVRPLAFGSESSIGDARLFYAGPVHHSTHFALMVANRNTQQHTAQLEHEAF